jgi:hypothetical protein
LQVKLAQCCKRARFDSGLSVEHPKKMLIATRRIATVLMALFVSAGNVAVCAGWAPTPEARMECCSGDGPCPMHKGESESGQSQHSVSQAQADSCCASSERDSSNQSSPTNVAAISSAVLGPGTVLPAHVPALVLSDAWRTVAPIASPPVPKHLLLSVFLV